MSLARLAIVVALAPSVLVQGCSACDDDEAPRVEEPIRVTFHVRTGLSSGGPMPGVSRTGVIEIEVDPPIEVTADCTGPERELAVDTEGTRVGYRCGRGTDWRMIYVGTEGRAFQHCDPVGGGARSVDWSAVPGLEEAAPMLLVCDRLSHRRRAPGEGGLLAELEASRIDLGRVLIASMALPTPSSRRGAADGPWLRAFATLDEREAAPVRAALREVLRNGAGATAVWRALAVLGLPEDADVLEARATELAGRPLEETAARNALAALLRGLLRQRPARAGGLACSAFEAATADRQRSRLPLHLVYVLGGAGEDAERCAPLEEYSRGSCGTTLLCGEQRDRVCTPDDLLPRLAQELGEDPVAAVRDARRTQDFGVRPLARAALAAMFARDASVQESMRRADRILYRQDPDTPGCGDVTEPDTPCACFQDVVAQARSVCELTAGESRGTASGCSFEVDDDARVIRGRRR